MLVFEQTEENLQCGNGGAAKASSGNGGGALATKKASGAPTSAMSQPAARAVNAAFAELAARGSTGRVQNPRVDGGAFSPRALKASEARVRGGATSNIATKAQRAKAIDGYLKSTGQSTTAKTSKTPKAPKKSTSLAEQNRKRIARQKANAEKARAKK